MRLTVIGNGPPLRPLLGGLQPLPITLRAIITDEPTPTLRNQAQSLGVRAVYDVALFNSPDRLELGGYEDDWILSFNSTRVVPPELLVRFPKRAINCHPGSLRECAGLHLHQ